MNSLITTLSRERLEELASDFAMEGYATEEEQQEMARALLAVMDAKDKSEFELSQVSSEKQALIYWLRNEINLIESARDETPFGLDADGEMALKGICTALSALEAKPSCYTGSGSLEAVKAGCEGYIWRDCENSHPIGLYTAPPAPSAPEIAYDLAEPRTEATVITHYQSPPGWKLVPVEPSEEMIEAGDQFMDGLSRLGEAYEAMIAAAPSPGGE